MGRGSLNGEAGANRNNSAGADILFGEFSRDSEQQKIYRFQEQLQAALDTKDWSEVLLTLENLKPELSANERLLEECVQKIQRMLPMDNDLTAQAFPKTAFDSKATTAELKQLVRTQALGELHLGIPCGALATEGPLAAELITRASSWPGIVVGRRWPVEERNRVTELLSQSESSEGVDKILKPIIEDVVKVTVAVDGASQGFNHLPSHMESIIAGQDPYCCKHIQSDRLHLLTTEYGKKTRCGKDLSSKVSQQWYNVSRGEWREAWEGHSRKYKCCKGCRANSTTAGEAHSVKLYGLENIQQLNDQALTTVRKKLNEPSFDYTELLQTVRDTEALLTKQLTLQYLRETFAIDNSQGWQLLLDSKIQQPLPTISDGDLQDLVEQIAAAANKSNGVELSRSKALLLLQQLQVEQGLIQPTNREDSKRWSRWSRGYNNKRKPTDEEHLFIPDPVSKSVFIQVPLCGQRISYPQKPNMLRKQATHRCPICEKMLKANNKIGSG